MNGMTGRSGWHQPSSLLGLPQNLHIEIAMRIGVTSEWPLADLCSLRVTFSTMRHVCGCWRKINTSRQAHSKPNEDGLKHVPDPKRASQFSWNWQRMKNS
jgi:hypothetical protein